jgi:glutamate synthase (NADPH) large chain
MSLEQINESCRTVTAAPIDARRIGLPAPQGLYHPRNEHDACGVGFVAHIKGRKSHAIIQQGLKILENLDHRGAVGADKLMGDGAGILLQIPDALYRDDMAQQGVTLPPPDEYGVAMVFLLKETASRLACEQELERAVRAKGQVVLGWRDVPLDADMPMSPTVRDCEPVIRQLFIGRSARCLRVGLGASAFFDQYFPGLAFGSPLPHDRAQWRNQYRQRQFQLAARPRRYDAIGGAGR